MSAIRVGLIGDHSDEVVAHQAVPRALALAGHETGQRVVPASMGTERLEEETAAKLVDLDALLCTPASRYIGRDGALEAIRYARHGRPVPGRNTTPQPLRSPTCPP